MTMEEICDLLEWDQNTLEKHRRVAWDCFSDDEKFIFFLTQRYNITVLQERLAEYEDFDSH